MAARSIDPDRTGIALGARHFSACILQRPTIGWIEADCTEIAGSPPARHALAALRHAWPVGLRTRAFSLGAGINEAALADLADLDGSLAPARITVPLAWPQAEGPFPGALLPLPYDETTLARVARDVDAIQDRLRRTILVENPPARRARLNSAAAEAEFLAALVRRTGAGIACDLANLHVATRNHGGDAQSWLGALPGPAIGAIRIAGVDRVALADDEWLIADGTGPVTGAVWALHGIATRCFPGAPSLLAWTAAGPRLERLVAEATRADRWRRAALDVAMVYFDDDAEPQRGARGEVIPQFGSGAVVARSTMAAIQRQGALNPPGEPPGRAPSGRTAHVGGAGAAAEPTVPLRVHA